MSEREEKLINKITKLQKVHNSLKIEDEIEKYKKEIKNTEKDIENTKKEIKKLSSKLEKLQKNNANNDSSNNHKNIEDKNNELRNIKNDNNMKNQILNNLTINAEHYKDEKYILNLIHFWNPQTMFKYVQLYDKKNE